MQNPFTQTERPGRLSDSAVRKKQRVCLCGCRVVMDGCQPVAASIRRQHDAGPFVLASHLYNQSLSFGTSGLSLLSRRVWGEFCLK